MRRLMKHNNHECTWSAEDHHLCDLLHRLLNAHRKLSSMVVDEFGTEVHTLDPALLPRLPKFVLLGNKMEKDEPRGIKPPLVDYHDLFVEVCEELEALAVQLQRESEEKEEKEEVSLGKG